MAAFWRTPAGLHVASARLPVEAELASFDGATGWLNSELLTPAGGQIACRFHARDLNLVMGPAAPGTPLRFRVGIDGQPPGQAHGTDTDAGGNGTLTQQRVYQLMRQPGPITDRTCKITFPDPGDSRQLPRPPRKARPSRR